MKTLLNRVGTGFGYFLIFGVALYALSYFLPGYQPGFLNNKPLGNLFWRSVFFTHVGLGAVALGLGPFQFSRQLRQRRVGLHRRLGKIYVFSILVGSTAAFCTAWFADTGWVAAVGFAGLATAWFYTTFRAYRAIRRGQIRSHQEWMFRSYAATLSAVTLRIILPLELAAFQLPFSVAYPIVAWMCWVPNLIFVEWWILRKNRSHTPVLSGTAE
ncbi:hypothetical protein GCM10028803_48520 [Larkinella knui]|uniref:DUF2306 domain-containing protein n=1 Tax=Larkinella knui TaxID=2025310 RepID=A0A3P1CQS0_9BACT|nr:DUF2306 domain-containing protein [Larkinella knui]RRB15426.1 DUF2306 domain-containing protein [Larkinella knui]